jgi:flagellar biosynthesis/type III secretory pathway protein FliH
MLRRVSARDEVRLEYEAREKAWRDEQARTAYALQTGFAEGREQGRAEGEAKGRAEILSLVRQGLSADEIERTLGRVLA